MLGTFIKNCWRSLTRTSGRGDAPPAGSGLPAMQRVVRDELRAALVTLLHEPLAHPKIIDYEMVAHVQAAASSAAYLVDHMMNARNLVRRDVLLEFALDRCAIDGLIMEFGVYRGASLRAIARRANQEVHGFDSFEGLPQDWTYFQKQGRFSLHGAVPHFEESNIRVHKGWFDRTLPPFLAEHAGPARFVHVDCDIYASTRTVLELLKSRIVSGSVIVFDEYLNYPAWQQHEFRAFQEYIAATGMQYRYLGFASSDCAVAVAIL